MDDNLNALTECFDFIYYVLNLRGNYFGFDLSFLEIIIGASFVGLLLYAFFRIID